MVSKKQTLSKATFAAGCFWHVEHAFAQVNGIVKTTVGYTGGKMNNPTYAQVCSGETQHTESVLVEFDPEKVSYSKLLDIFWKIHDPTQLNRQGPDVGTQYRSAIFYHSSEQKKIALASKAKLEKSHKFKGKIVTQIVPAGKFYKAEDYHQKYFEKHGKVC